MKSWVKAWLGAGVGCLVCGVVLTGIGVASGGNKYVKAADLNKMDGAAKKEDNEALLSKTKIVLIQPLMIHFQPETVLFYEQKYEYPFPSPYSTIDCSNTFCACSFLNSTILSCNDLSLSPII